MFEIAARREFLVRRAGPRKSWAMDASARKLTLLQLVGLQLVGGPAVLASYAWCLSVWPEASAQMWGGVPEVVRPVYTAWMFVAAAGYLAYSYVFTFRVDLPALAVPLLGKARGRGLLMLCYALVLACSALWMPMTKWLLDEPSTLRFALVCVDLLLVALGSLGLFVVALRMQPRPPGRLRALAVVGTILFSVQTVLLDALVWTVLW